MHTELFECGPDGRPTSSALASEQTTVPNPKRWDTVHPNLYVAVTTVEQDWKPVDRCETTFEVSTILFTPDNSFLLNGKRVQLQGVCDHHDLGALGNALNDRAL